MYFAVNYSWGPELDGQFQIVGFANGLPIIAWKQPKQEIPDNLIKAILDYERMHLL